MPNTDSGNATGLPENIPLDHPAFKAVKAAQTLTDRAHDLVKTAAMAMQMLEDEMGATSVQAVLNHAVADIFDAEREIGKFEQEFAKLLAAPNRESNHD